MAPATTSPISAPFSSRPACGRSDAHRRYRAHGFTLVELLVVIGIIVLLLGIMAPTITRAWRAGDRARTAADLQAIAAGLEAYRNDHGDYPRVGGKPYQNASDLGYNGARMLCRALIGPGPGVGKSATDYPSIPDGAGVRPSNNPTAQETEPGPGFRVRGTQGKVYGPYLASNQIRMGNPTNEALKTPGLLALMDTANNPILYYPASGRPNIRADKGYIREYDGDTLPPGGRPLYNSKDNIKAMTTQVFSRMMGDGTAATAPNGKIDGNEQPAYEGPYILWSSGADGVFGSTTTLAKSDDVTNFHK